MRWRIPGPVFVPLFTCVDWMRSSAYMSELPTSRASSIRYLPDDPAMSMHSTAPPTTAHVDSCCRQVPASDPLLKLSACFVTAPTLPGRGPGSAGGEEPRPVQDRRDRRGVGGDVPRQR